jgi:hypothetical protein
MAQIFFRILAKNRCRSGDAGNETSFSTCNSSFSSFNLLAKDVNKNRLEGSPKAKKKQKWKVTTSIDALMMEIYASAGYNNTLWFSTRIRDWIVNNRRWTTCLKVNRWASSTIPLGDGKGGPGALPSDGNSGVVEPRTRLRQFQI